MNIVSLVFIVEGTWRAGPRACMRFQARCRFGTHSPGVEKALEPLGYYLYSGPGFGVVSCFDIKHLPVLSPVGWQHMNTRFDGLIAGCLLGDESKGL